ncbi:TadE/TadG family type IV pilus assembly protein [Kineococcus gynurae]|uniref:TadE/TadG family type IV pilus assembly protein n=1 Tax=Kineococcus gynurae TaxID=452979 RepID=A0ABV5LXN1_9ACTN
MTPRTTRRTTRRGPADAGTAALELTLAAPVLLLLLALLLTWARLGHVHAALDAGVRDAARTATGQRSAGDAALAARSVVLDALGPGDCADSLQLDPVGPFTPGRAVTVRAHCRFSVLDLGLPSAPGELRLSSSFSSPLDPNREVS